MKINEECINYNLVRLIDLYLWTPEEYKDEPGTMIAVLSHIRGMIDFAKCMKEVLKS
jgi:hypothetical protein